MSTSAVHLAAPESSLPRGTVTPGSRVDAQLGSYPAMPKETQQFRPHSPNWWDPQERRNYGEVLHEEDDVLNMWSPDKYKTKPTKALGDFLIAVGALASFSYVVYRMTPEPPMARKTFPRDGLSAELNAPPATAPVDAEEEEE
ncbi:hypothetical protein MSPP1_000938 [Malassezia sp. CBS 17886]|nr:hypothetical protein MSPP1_000938 [Malassezia sp. CBS 17886]